MGWNRGVPGILTSSAFGPGFEDFWTLMLGLASGLGLGFGPGLVARLTPGSRPLVD